MDITGCAAIVGSPEDAAKLVRRRVREELGIVASVGIATSKAVAKVASDRAKPDGIVVVAPGEEAAFLAPLPLRALPLLGPKLAQRLEQLGISTLGQLASAPAASLESLLGRHGRELIARARGIDPSPVAGREFQKSISREGTFAVDVADPAHLRAVLRGFSETVGSQHRASGRRARTVSLNVRIDDFTTIARSVTLRRPVSSDAALYGAAQALLQTVREKEKRPVRLIGVGAENLVEDVVQLALEPVQEEREESISAVFDRVRRKYGQRSLQTGRTAFDAATASDDSILERRVGLSAQIGRAGQI